MLVAEREVVTEWRPLVEEFELKVVVTVVLEEWLLVQAEWVFVLFSRVWPVVVEAEAVEPEHQIPSSML